MPQDHFFLLCGVDLTKKTKQEIQKDLQQHIPQVSVLGFMPGIHYRDVGLDEKMTKLSLVKLGYLGDAGPLCIDGKPSIRRIPKEMTMKTNCKLDPSIVDVIPDILREMSYLEESTGIKCGKGRKTGYWVTGQMYQVTIAINYLKDKYRSIPDMYQLTGSEYIIEEQKKWVEDFINGDMKWEFKGMKIPNFKPCLSKEVPVLLPDMALTYCLYPDGLITNIKALSVSFDVNQGSTHHVIRIESASEKNEMAYIESFFSSYNNVRKNNKVVNIDSSLPTDFRLFLQEIITSQVKPMLTIERLKTKQVSLLYKNYFAEKAESLMERYQRYNRPSENCGLRLFDHQCLEESEEEIDTDIMQEHQVVHTSKVKQNVKKSCISAHEQKIKQGGESESKPKYQELVIADGSDQQRSQYLYLTRWQDIQDKARECQVDVQYKQGCFATDQATQCSNFDEYLKGMLASVLSTSLVPKNLESYSWKDLLFVYCNDDAQLRVTGTKQAIQLLTQSDQDSTQVVDKQDGKLEGTKSEDDHVVSSNVKKTKHSKRKRELLSNDNSLRQEAEPVHMLREIIEEMEEDYLEELTRPSEGVAAYTYSALGVTVHVGKGDLTKLRVHAIVNAANKKLRHEGGVAYAIAKAAGPRLNEDCKRILENGPLITANVCITDAGMLPCKWIIHAVGPAMQDFHGRESECLDLLKRTFLNCLEEASVQGYRSIAIPAISSGIYGVKPESVAKIATEALQEFLTSCMQTSLRLVRFIDINNTMIELFTSRINRLVDRGFLQASRE